MDDRRDAGFPEIWLPDRSRAFRQIVPDFGPHSLDGGEPGHFADGHCLHGCSQAFSVGRERAAVMANGAQRKEIDGSPLKGSEAGLNMQLRSKGE